MNIIFATDDNYAPFLGVAIYSLLKSNQEDTENTYTDKISIYILDMDISDVNKEKLKKTIEIYNCEIIYINTTKIQKYLEEKITNPVRSLATYYRLFLPSLLPLNVEKVIYLDCDSIIMSSLKELWDTEISNYDIAGVLDIISPKVKLKVGLSIDESYFNAGMLLINLKKWRNENKEEEMINFILAHNGNVCYHDQGTINGVCKDKKIIHPKFNVMTPFFVMSVNQLKRYHNIHSYYTQKELDEATKNPVFCHLTPYLTDRPWVKGNFHPLKNLYLKFQKETLWANVQRKNNGKQLKPWLKTAFKFLPNDVFIKIVQLIANKN